MTAMVAARTTATRAPVTTLTLGDPTADSYNVWRMRWAIIWIVLIGLVLIPFFLFEQQFNALSARMTESGTATSLVALAVVGLLASDVLLPIPSSIVST